MQASEGILEEMQNRYLLKPQQSTNALAIYWYKINADLSKYSSPPLYTKI